MIDAKAFGVELADVVKAATAPLLARIGALEKALEDRPVPAAGKDGLDGRDGKDGESVTLDDVLPMLSEQVKAYLDAIPEPKDGRDGAPGADGKDGLPGEKGEPGKDGVGLAGAMIDRSGGLVITLTNGDVKALGPVIGADGNPGADGKDGIGFDDLSVEYDGERTVSLVFAKGDADRVFSFALPMMIDRGVFADDREYQRGDSVTYGGSMWIAQKDAPEGKPSLSGDWRLAVKKGRDGRSA